MTTHLECIPCLLRQAIGALGLCPQSPEARQGLVRELLLGTTALDFSLPPPVLAGAVQAQLRELTGCDDPYHALKAGHNQLALALRPALADAVRRHPDPFAAAVRLAIAANVIDVGAKSGVTESGIRAALATALDQPLVGDLEALRAAVRDARRILYLADNAGEIVLDRVLLERLPRGAVTVAVRGRPVLNDATRVDAVAAGLPELADVIDNGSSAPGTALADCAPRFRRRFREADLIIAKGQGNFETLAGIAAPLFCLFRVKCDLVAAQIGQPVGSHVVWRAPSAR